MGKTITEYSVVSTFSDIVQECIQLIQDLCLSKKN